MGIMYCHRDRYVNSENCAWDNELLNKLHLSVVLSAVTDSKLFEID